MGLDMYLYAEKYHHQYNKDGKKLREADEYSLAYERFDAGYWRKHPNLHGYIIQEFADGRDECQEIYLSKDEILKILDAIKSGALPKTNGFFFGESDGSESKRDIKIFKRALKWLEEDENGVSRSIIYCASW